MTTMTSHNERKGSVLLIVSPLGGDVAFVCHHFRDLGATSIYNECSVETALATLRDLALPLITCEEPFGGIDSWQGLFSFLDHSMALPRVIIAADSVGSATWAATVFSALAEIVVIPGSMDELLHHVR